ncbi:MAG: DUF4976 domain-containing protein [Verrucomicrobiales bacterium]|nr:DUF4976 domain-containing protein [Verrucomicrobiales bacterium]
MPLIVSVPGKSPAVSDSFVELLDLYPTTSALCGLEVPARLQGKDLTPILNDPKQQVRDATFTISGGDKAFLWREDRWAFIQYGEDASKGMELFDMHQDPQQFTNLANSPAHQQQVKHLRAKIAAKLAAIRHNDLQP